MLRQKGEWILIPVKAETRQHLDNVKRTKIQSYDSLINELINSYEQLPKITKDKEIK